jgi:hypothetical protein
MLGSAFQTIKIPHLYKRRKGNKRGTKQTEIRKQSQELLIEKGHCFVTGDIFLRHRTL